MKHLHAVDHGGRNTVGGHRSLDCIGKFDHE